jgi:GMP synthase-like glutamine amidotransferase
MIASVVFIIAGKHFCMSIEREVLAVQARIDPDRLYKEQKTLEAFAKTTGKTIRFVNPLLSSDIDWNKTEKITKEFAGILFLGTPDMDFSYKNTNTEQGKRREIYLNKVIPLIQKGYDKDVSMHGICFGHQAMAIAAGGETIVKQTEEQKETGTVTLQLTEQGQEDILFRGLPKEIKIIAIHKDSVAALPPDFHILGSTENDPYSALRRGNATSTQTHPERNDVVALSASIEQSRESILGAYTVTHKLEPPDNTGIIIVNFLTNIQSQGDIFVSYPSPKAA